MTTTIKSMREDTLQTLGLGTVLDIFKKGKLPVETGELVDRVFGEADKRGAMVISGANGIVGAGKIMQFGSRLQPYDVPIVALDFPGAADGIGQQFSGLKRAFGSAGANQIMSNVVRLHYDGKKLPGQLHHYNPRFLLEAIPEILEIKRAHYDVFRAAFPGIEIRSVTSGFPSSQLGVGIAHPAFPHEINKIFEMVEDQPSDITQLLWSLGLIPIPVGDHWSFVLDVLFCGLTSIAIKYHRASNMPFWKIDKYIRKFLGPNPFRAHDVIGAKGANFLTWTCLHHLCQHYGDLYKPGPELDERKVTGQNWYPPNHFRPLVNWTLDRVEEDEFLTRVLGPYFQMASLLLHEQRGHLSHLNLIGEMCAQFRTGPLAYIRQLGAEAVIKRVDDFHHLQPEAKTGSWHPEVFEALKAAPWQQLYVNAQHDGDVGVISINRESYSKAVDEEMNRAIDWLIAENIQRVILSGDFHLATQLVGADTADFYPALEDEAIGKAISSSWSRTARRLYRDFKVSVGVITGKRCLGGMLELLSHCSYLVSVSDVKLGFPEVTLPVVPGMEGCHWPLRKAKTADRPKLLHMLLEGSFLPAGDTVGWYVDYAGTLSETLSTAWKIASGGDHGLALRLLEEGPVSGIPAGIRGLSPGDASLEAARTAIFNTVKESCAASLAESLEIQANHSAAFMAGKHCLKGVIGTEYKKTVTV